MPTICKLDIPNKFIFPLNSEQQNLEAENERRDGEEEKEDDERWQFGSFFLTQCHEMRGVSKVNKRIIITTST